MHAELPQKFQNIQAKDHYGRNVQTEQNETESLQNAEFILCWPVLQCGVCAQ